MKTKRYPGSKVKEKVEPLYSREVDFPAQIGQNVKRSAETAPKTERRTERRTERQRPRMSVNRTVGQREQRAQKDIQTADSGSPTVVSGDQVQFNQIGKLMRIGQTERPADISSQFVFAARKNRRAADCQ